MASVSFITVKMKQSQTTLSVTAPHRGLHELTADVTAWVMTQKIRTGLLTLFCRHTSASLTIQENADPDVVHDLEQALDGLAPESAPHYRHTTEGPDDMPAHIKGMLTDVSVWIPIVDGKLALGTWQGIFLIESRSRPRSRDIILHLNGE